MSGLVSIDINDKALKDIAVSMAASRKDIDIALQRALRKTTRWLMARLAKEVASDTGIPSSVIKRRLKHHLSTDKRSVKVWLGLAPVSAINVNARQIGAGVKAAKHLFSGAFIATARGKQHVFKRTTKARLPIEKQTIAIDRQADTVIELSILPRLERRFQTTFTQELRWLTR